MNDEAGKPNKRGGWNEGNASPGDFSEDIVALAQSVPSEKPAGAMYLALERITASYRLLLARKPVRDVEETLAEADAALASHAETAPVVAHKAVNLGDNAACASPDERKAETAPQAPAGQAVAWQIRRIEERPNGKWLEASEEGYKAAIRVPAVWDGRALTSLNPEAPQAPAGEQS